MVNNSSYYIKSQIPEFVSINYPKYTEFIELYAAFVSLKGNSSDILANRASDTDIDTASEEYIDKYFETYHKQFSYSAPRLDKRNFLKALNKIYEAKGTEKALRLIFRLLYNEEIEIKHPFDQALFTSAGQWVRESFFTLNTQFGDVYSSENLLVLSNSSGKFFLKSTRYERITSSSVRFYFNISTKLYVEDNQTVFIYVPDSDEVPSYVGELIKSPNRLTIQKEGKAWQKGQVVVIPGTVKNTIGRVTKVNSTGGITGIEILEFGYEHSLNQVTAISSYPNKPSSTSTNLVSTLVSINPNVYSHVLDIQDFTTGIYENIFGIIGGNSPNSYFLEDYVEYSYNGAEVISSTYIEGETIQPAPYDYGITMEEWLASQAVFVYTHENYTDMKGYYKDERGQLSNQNIRLQDNFYYQAFSYVIESVNDISDYKNILDLVHPAGTKAFADILKTIVYDENVTASRTLSYDVAYFLDTTSSADVFIQHFYKNLLENISTSDILTKDFIKYHLTDSASAVSLDTAALTSDSDYSVDYFAELYTDLNLQLSIGQ